jgi:hypothetical protein
VLHQVITASCFVGRKQDLVSRPSPVFRPLGHNHKHYPSIARPRSRPSRHPVGKQATLLAFGSIPFASFTSNTAVQLDISIRIPFLHHQLTLISALAIIQLTSDTHSSAIDSYNIRTAKMPTPSTRSLRLKSSMRNNMNAACCLHPSHNNRSLSPNPDEPARPSPLALDFIFALAALPTNHPHALKIELPPPAAEEDEHNIPMPKVRRMKKSPSSAAFSSALAHSGLVHRVGRRLKRRATFSGDRSLLENGAGSSLRDEARFDEDAKRLSSGEVLGAVDAEEDHDGSAGGEHGDGDPPTLRLREL